MEKIKIVGKRESGFIAKVGTFADMKWVIRGPNGEFIAMSRWRNDLQDAYKEQYEITFIEE